MQSVAASLWPLFQWLLVTSVQASLLICLILVVQSLLKRRLGVRWHYCLWLLLLIRMALPWAPAFRFSLFTMLQTVFQQPLRNIADVTSAAAAIGEQSAVGHSVLTIIRLSPLIWLVGAVGVAAHMVAANWRFSRKIAGSPVVRDSETLGMLDECKRRLAIRRRLRIVTTEHVESPALCGFIRPRLLLPAAMLRDLGKEQLRCVFLHELAHMRHLDILTCYLMSLLQVLHWFNPLVWYAFYRMRTDRELACDELVLSIADSDEPADYGRTIISMIELFNRNRARATMVGIMETQSQLKDRIAMIARFHKLPRWWSLTTAGLIVLVATVALTNATHSFTESHTIGRDQPPVHGPAQPLTTAPVGRGGMVIGRSGSRAGERTVMTSSGSSAAARGRRSGFAMSGRRTAAPAGGMFAAATAAESGAKTGDGMSRTAVQRSRSGFGGGFGRSAPATSESGTSQSPSEGAGAEERPVIAAGGG